MIRIGYVIPHQKSRLFFASFADIERTKRDVKVTIEKDFSLLLILLFSEARIRMEEALDDKEMREVVDKRLEDYTKKNYPNASLNVRKNLKN